MRPVLGKAPSNTKQPVIGTVRPKRRFVFSFKYYKQTEHFGIGSKDSGWFSAVLEKLSEISDYDYEYLSTNLRAKQAWRLHEVNFSAKGVLNPRASFDWVDRTYLENSVEFPFFQFQITKAHGRVVGFWDETGVFNIVVLDPNHNMQPSEYSDYKIRETVIARSDFAAAIITIEKAISVCGVTCGCRSLYSKIQVALVAGLADDTMLIPMSADIFSRCAKCVEEGLARKMEDIIATGLQSLSY